MSRPTFTPRPNTPPIRERRRCAVTIGGHSPWGPIQTIDTLATDHVWFVSTASHGGLRLSWEMWERLPRAVRSSFRHEPWAEEDCEYPIAIALLNFPGVEPARQGPTLWEAREMARRYYPAATAALRGVPAPCWYCGETLIARGFGPIGRPDRYCSAQHRAWGPRDALGKRIAETAGPA